MPTLFTFRKSALLALFQLLLLTAYAQPNFINKIPVPQLIDAANGTIQLQMQVKYHKFNPADSLNPNDSLNGSPSQTNGIRTYAYNATGITNYSILGPTLVWHTGDSTKIVLTNNLPDSSTTHWHGAEVDPHFDGGPHQPIAPGDAWYVNIKTLDSASTLWYHPHFHDRTLYHVQMGLSGMMMVKQAGDPLANTLPHTYGADDIPVIIGDLGFTKRSGTTAPMVIDTTKAKRPFNLVNGVTNPYVELPAHLVRLRILNGSTRKGMKFGFTPAYTDPTSALLNFYLVATDGGYIIKTDTMKMMTVGPGERNEVVLDLSSFSPGQKLYLRNFKEYLPNYIIGSPFTPPTPGGGGKDTTSGKAFLEIRIVADNTFSNYTPVTSFTPVATSWGPVLQDTTNARYRYKRLVLIPGTTGPNAFNIDSTAYNMNTINDTICVNTKEIWTIDNTTPIAHPFHIHKIQFRILDIDSLGTKINLAKRGLNGPKDDVLIYPKWKLRFIGYYDDYPDSIEAMHTYMYHCHILTHEDDLGGGMMHQFVVTFPNLCSHTTGLNQQLNDGELLLFPNPNSGDFSLKFNANGQASSIQITDLLGRVCYREQMTGSEYNKTIHLPEKGVYLLTLYYGRQIINKKVVVD